MIISASRRTDIPAFYSEWFLNRLKEGFVLARNPMNHAQVSKIILSPDLVDCIVFWTKDPGNMMDKLAAVDSLGYQYYFQFTLTPYGRDIEPFLRDKELLINAFIELSEVIGREKVMWRYDPIILNQDLTIEYHLEKFEYLCGRLKGYTDVCSISFVDIYSKLSKTVKNRILREITGDEMHRLTKGFADISRKYGIELRSCCENINLSDYGLKPARCIDKALIEKICGCRLTAKPELNQREGCACIQSIDIGAYNTCLHGCIYCYANYSHQAVESNSRKHDPMGDILIGSVDKDEKVNLRKMQSLKEYNYSFLPDNE